MGLMDIFRRKSRKDDETIYSKEVVLDTKEMEVFQKLKTKPIEPATEIKKVSKDRMLSESSAYKTADSMLRSLQELKEYLAGMDTARFTAFWAENKAHLKTWIGTNFEESFARIFINFSTKDEAILALANYLYPSTEIRLRPTKTEELTKAVDNTIIRYQEVKDKIKNARRQGANTFISQTKLMNIKPKIDYCESAQDILGLENINQMLAQILTDLEYEIKMKKEEEENAVRKPGQ